jgi:hypothetical protein
MRRAPDHFKVAETLITETNLIATIVSKTVKNTSSILRNSSSQACNTRRKLRERQVVS